MKRFVFLLLLLVVFGFAAECGAQQAAEPAPLNLEVTLRIEGGRVVSVRQNPIEGDDNIVVPVSACVAATIFIVAAGFWANKEAFARDDR